MQMWRLVRIALIVLEVGGGFMGVTIILLSQKWNADEPLYAWVLQISICMLFVLGITAGVTLVERPQLGVVLSAVYQAIQIPDIRGPLFIYRFYSGLQLGAGWWEGKIAFFLEPGARCTLLLFARTEPWRISVNLLAIGLFFYLWLRLRRRNRESGESGDSILNSKPK
jgi:hypothetical protein